MPRDVRGVDVEAVRSMLYTENEEALAWLQAGGPDKLRTITGGEGSDSKLYEKKHAVAFVEGLYELGAVRVTAVNIDRLCQEHEDTDRLLVELPTDTEARAKIYAFQNEFAAGRGWDPSPDDGGLYLIFWWD
jgi:hypothetical protein